ncbi:MAG: SPOR domain-containing protein [Ignavibacteria bacterium]
MKNIKFRICLWLNLFIISLIFYACTGEYPDEEVIVVEDTVYVKMDTLIQRHKTTEKLDLRMVVQLAAFSKRENADEFAKKAKEKLGFLPNITYFDNYYIVTVGSFTDASKAEDYLNYIKGKGFSEAFIRKVN